MLKRIRNVRLLATVALTTLTALSACATATTSLDDPYDNASPNSVRMRLTSATTSSGTKETLTLKASILNGTATEFRRLGCTRPALALDSATVSGWTELSAEQTESLAVCFSPYYIISAGTTQSFETGFVRKNPATSFPRGVALRLRVVGATPDAGPFATVILAP